MYFYYEGSQIGRRAKLKTEKKEKRRQKMLTLNKDLNGEAIDYLTDPKKRRELFLTLLSVEGVQLPPKEELRRFLEILHRANFALCKKVETLTL